MKCTALYCRSKSSGFRHFGSHHRNILKMKGHRFPRGHYGHHHKRHNGTLGKHLMKYLHGRKYFDQHEESHHNSKSEHQFDSFHHRGHRNEYNEEQRDDFHGKHLHDHLGGSKFGRHHGGHHDWSREGFKSGHQIGFKYRSLKENQCDDSKTKHGPAHGKHGPLGKCLRGHGGKFLQVSDVEYHSDKFELRASEKKHHGRSGRFRINYHGEYHHVFNKTFKHGFHSKVQHGPHEKLKLFSQGPHEKLNLFRHGPHGKLKHFRHGPHKKLMHFRLGNGNHGRGLFDDEKNQHEEKQQADEEKINYPEQHPDKKQISEEVFSEPESEKERHE
ncbi:hypothetical protein AVEN_219581-1 [Araneus ventricosus]|uniref:Uncharacterized protein n=1 Tax=Araneus ventricosus TaxID=182803 RepID=A0A4Y2IT73_ARAVE|nr:hypothetical protein AVEN_219581-1 [Araneus ventricosus]